MNKPTVRIISKQTETTSSKQVTSSQADELLRKYHLEQQQKQIDINQEDNFRGFVGIEVPKQKIYDPRVDADSNGMYHNSSWGTDQEMGLNYEIKIVSDMPLPKN